MNRDAFGIRLEAINEGEIPARSERPFFFPVPFRSPGCQIHSGTSSDTTSVIPLCLTFRTSSTWEAHVTFFGRKQKGPGVYPPGPNPSKISFLVTLQRIWSALAAG